jgi:hypothetical protein
VRAQVNFGFQSQLVCFKLHIHLFNLQTRLGREGLSLGRILQDPQYIKTLFAFN